MWNTVDTIREECFDVAVVGGGTAGCFAAIAAARLGAKTILIEKASMLGGTMTTAAVAFPGLFHAWGRQIIDGPCWESILRAAALGGAVIPAVTYQPQHHWQEQIPVNRFIYASVLDEMCLEAGVRVMLHTTLCSAKERDAAVDLLLAGKEGAVAIHASQAVDATGDASLAQQLGYPIRYSEEVQPATLINDLDGYDLGTLDRDSFLAFLEQQVEKGTLHPRDYQGFYLWDQLQNKRISMHIPATDAHTTEGRTRLEMDARKELLRIVRVLREYPGLQKMRVAAFAEECGVRETVRIEGEVCMSAEKYVSGYHYEDAICYAFYPIDRHKETGIHQIFLEPECIPTIPFRALLPKNTRRLLVAGRCVSSDRDTQSAVRVCAPCMAMGQAAGVAAALAAEKDLLLSQLPYGELCRGLRTIGAIIPEQ